MHAGKPAHLAPMPASARVGLCSPCMRLDLDCADVCFTTSALTSRRTGSNNPVIQAMLAACQASCCACAEECDRHAAHHSIAALRRGLPRLRAGMFGSDKRHANALSNC